MKNPRFECSTDEESKDLANASPFSEDDKDMLMLNFLDYKLRATKAAANMSETLNIENKKSRKVLADQPLMVSGSGSSNHCQLVESESSE
jgi:hypothetical protein